MSSDRNYAIRRAALEDIPALIHHRAAMFSEMEVDGDYPAMRAAFGEWLAQALPDETYRAWVADSLAGEVIAGGGLVVHVKAPSPTSLCTVRAFIYNVYVEPSWREMGIARALMETMHEWCRDNQISSVSLHTSEFGRHLYESMGYEPTHELARLL